MDKGNEQISLAISSGEFTDLTSLVPVCTIMLANVSLLNPQL